MFTRFRPVPKETPPVLPERVRYALSYREARMGVEEIKSLFGTTNFRELGFYLLLKATAGDFDAQKSLLLTAGQHNFRISELTRDEVNPIIAGVDNDRQVAGAKLASVSRQGMDNWIEGCNLALERNNARGSKLFVAAYAPLIAIEGVAKHGQTSGSELSLGVLEPELIAADQGQRIGFMLSSTDGVLDINPLNRDFSRPQNALIFDDVRNGGGVMDRIIAFWMEGTDERPNFVAACHPSTHH